ncbi:MAG: class II glutamine amidotransferase [Planctomycetota bacterium]
MCRLVLYLGPPITLASLITDPVNSLIRQSFASKERVEPLNGDGFGVAWYAHGLDEDRPAMFKSISPAWNNRNLQDLCRVTQSGCILAHVRAATSAQSVDEVNCHPFAWKHYAFAHNGDVGGFRKIRRTLLRGLSDDAFNVVRGSTDSEHTFALWVDHMLKLRAGGAEETADTMAEAMRRTISDLVRMGADAEVDEACYLNTVVTDGKRAVVTHYSSDPEYIDSLHLHSAKRYTCVAGHTAIIQRGNDAASAIVVASEALSNETGWSRIDKNRVVVIDERLGTVMREIRVGEPVA